MQHAMMDVGEEDDLQKSFEFPCKKQKTSEPFNWSEDSLQQLFAKKADLYSEFKVNYMMGCCNEQGAILTDMLCFLQFILLSVNEFERLDYGESRTFAELASAKAWLHAMYVQLNVQPDLLSIAITCRRAAQTRMLIALVQAAQHCVEGFKMVFGVQSLSCCKIVHSMHDQGLATTPILYCLWNPYMTGAGAGGAAVGVEHEAVYGACRHMFCMLLTLEKLTLAQTPSNVKNLLSKEVKAHTQALASQHMLLSQNLGKICDVIVRMQDKKGLPVQYIEDLVKEVIIPHLRIVKTPQFDEDVAHAMKTCIDIISHGVKNLAHVQVFSQFVELMATHCIYDYTKAIETPSKEASSWVSQSWVLNHVL